MFETFKCLTKITPIPVPCRIFKQDRKTSEYNKGLPQRNEFIFFCRHAQEIIFSAKKLRLEGQGFANSESTN